MKRISVNLTERQIAALHELANVTGLKFAEVLRRLLDQALRAEALSTRAQSGEQSHGPR